MFESVLLALRATRGRGWGRTFLTSSLVLGGAVAFGVTEVACGHDTNGAASGQPGSTATTPATTVPTPTGTTPAEPQPSDCIEPSCAIGPLPLNAHATRLTHEQWERTTRDLLHLASNSGLSASFPADPAPRSDRFGRNAESLIVSRTLWSEYQRAAEALAVRVTIDAPSLDAILPAGAKAGDTATRIQAFLQDFLPKAFRRPVAAAEITRLIAIGDKAALNDPQSDPFLVRVKWIVATVLQAPLFVYRVEVGEGAVTDGRAALSAYELASKLSYAIWGTMPDAALFNAAKTGKLTTPATLAPVVAVMVKDSRADEVLLAFHTDFLGVPSYQGVVRTTDRFPNYYAEFGKDAQEDVTRTLREVMVSNPGGVKELYTSKVAFMNGKLAKVYGVDPTTIAGYTGDTSVFLRKDLQAGEREGLLLHAGWLAWQGHSKDPATIQRGAFMVRRVLCIPIGSPPPAAAGVDPAQSSANTNRKRVEAVTNGCGDGCHGAGGAINPLGFAFEHFDSLGAYRALDNGQPIDSADTLTAVGSFTDAVSLTRAVSTTSRAHACYAAHWYAYLSGADEVRVAPKWLSPIVADSIKGASARTLIAGLVQTPAFLTTSR